MSRERKALYLCKTPAPFRCRDLLSSYFFQQYVEVDGLGYEIVHSA